MNFADQWILSRLDYTVDQARKAIDGYRFNDGQIFLLYTLSTAKDTIQIEERPEYIETEEGAPGLERVFTKKGKNDSPVYLSTQSRVVELIKTKTTF